MPLRGTARGCKRRTHLRFAGAGSSVCSPTPAAGRTPARRSRSAVAGEPPIHPRLLAMIVAGRYHGMELDPNEFRGTAGDKIAVRGVAVRLGAEFRHVGARRAAALAPSDAVPQHRPGGAAVQRRHRRPADRRQHRAQGRLHQGPARARKPTPPVAGRRNAAGRGVDRRGRAAARQPRLRRGRCAVLAALAARPGDAGEEVAARHRHRLARAQHPDHLPAADGHDGDGQGADAPQLLDPGR